MLRFPAREPRPAARPSLRLLPSTPPALVPEHISARAAALIVGLALLFGALVRISFVTAADFPINDGGLFYAMSSDLQSNGYVIPQFTSYNFDRIPFAYPPLSFYATALLEDMSPLSMFGVLRLIPLSTNLIVMLAFVALARRMSADRASFAASVAAFALIPRSYEWMIMGGGLTRSFGILFAILALHEAHRLFAGRQRSAALTLGLLGGLTLLSHPEIAWFLGFSSLLFLASEGRLRTGTAGAFVAVLIAVAVAAPWWIQVLMHHGASPFVAAATTASPSQSNPIVSFLVFRPTDEPMFAIVAAMALLGLVHCLSAGQRLLPIWLLTCALLDPRSFANVAVIPVSLLAGVAVGGVLLPMLLRPERSASDARRWLLPSAVFVFLGLYALMNALIATPQLLDAMSKDERAAMAWVAANTPEDSEFLVVSDQQWALDRTSEWLPVLTHRRSIATVQGYEWRRGAFGDRLASYMEVQSCSERDASCVDAWQANRTAEFDYVYMPKVAEVQQGFVEDPYECCAPLRTSLRTDDRYEVVFDGPGATVFKLVE